MDSRIQEIFAFGIRAPVPGKPKYSCRKLESHWHLQCGIQVPPKKIWSPVTGIRNPESQTVLDPFIHVRESGFRNPGNFCQWNPGVWNPEYSCRNLESHWQLESGNRVPLEKIWNPVTGIRNPRRGIQNPWLSWIPLHMRQTDSLRSNFKRGTLRNSLSLLTF